MNLQRLFKPGWNPDALRDARRDLAIAEGEAGRPPTKEQQAKLADLRARVRALTPVQDAITVLGTGVTPQQNFSQRLIDQGTREGWLEMTGSQIILHSHAEEPPKLRAEAVAELDRMRKAMGGRKATDSEAAAIEKARKQKADAAGEPNSRVHVGDYIFTILREPGHYCCHCGEKLPENDGQADEDGLTVGAKHVQENHAGVPSPDPNNPAGYRWITHYETELTEAPAGSEGPKATVPRG